MIKKVAILIIVFSIAFGLNSQAQSLRNLFIDTTDNAVDASKWLNTVTGFVPMVMPITEPAIGYGAAGGLIFFHPTEYRVAAKEGKLGEPCQQTISPTPPSITGVGGGYTESDSWAAGIGHLAVLKKDKIRYTIGIGLGTANLDYYGKGLFPEVSRRFNMKFWGISNELSFRVSESNFWLGLGYKFAQLDVEFLRNYTWPNLNLNKIETRNGGLLPAISYDNRDNIFTPNKGFKAYVQYGFFDSWLGGTEQYQLLSSYLYGYHEFAPGHVSGIRFDMKNTFGEPTFVYLPYIVMRGIPSMKYQDNNVTLLEFEQRAKIYNRWSLVAFGGVAKTFPDISEFATEEWVYAYGTGFRYYLAKQFGLHMGMDFAWGPEDFAFYITFGSGWLRL